MEITKGNKQIEGDVGMIIDVLRIFWRLLRNKPVNVLLRDMSIHNNMFGKTVTVGRGDVEMIYIPRPNRKVILNVSFKPKRNKL